MIKKILMFKFLIFIVLPLLSRQTVIPNWIKKNVIGYWKKTGEGTQGFFEASKKDIVIILGSDNTIQYYEDRKKIGWGTFSIDSGIRNEFYKLNSTMSKNNLLCPDPNYDVRLSGYIMKADSLELVFGYAVVDMADSYFKRMSVKQIDKFLGKRQISKAIKRKSEKRLLAYFNKWQQMEPSIEAEEPKRALNIYQKEAYCFFNDFYERALRNAGKEHFGIIDISFLDKVSYSDFTYPTNELDSFITKKAEQYLERKIPFPKTDEESFFLRRYYFNILANKQPIFDHPLLNFMPNFAFRKDITFLLLRPNRRSVLQRNLSNNYKKQRKSGIFLDKFLVTGSGTIHDPRGGLKITGLIFNNTLDLAIVDYSYPFSWLSDIYQKVDGKWVFKGNLEHMVE